jgi:hypothetical protein
MGRLVKQVRRGGSPYADPIPRRLELVGKSWYLHCRRFHAHSAPGDHSTLARYGHYPGAGNCNAR